MSNLVVQTNVLALNSHRNLKVIGNKQFLASSRLSSGYRINSAADDAAGLAISEKMRAQIRGLDMASKNAQDGISLVQTAEGGMQEIDNMIQRIRELVVQAANDTNEGVSSISPSGADRRKLQDEIDQLTAGIDQMAGMVEFNKKRLLDGSYMDANVKNTKIAEIGAKLAAALGYAVATNAAALTVRATGAGSLTPLLQNGGGNVSIAATTFSVTAAGTGTTSWATGTATGTSYGATGVTASINLTDIMNASLLNMHAFISTTFASSILNNDAAFDAYIAKMDEYMSQLQDVINIYGGGNAALAASLQGGIDHAAAKKADLLTLKAGYEVAKADLASLVAYAGAPKGETLYFQVGANENQGISFGIGSIKTNILGIGNGNGTSTINVIKTTGTYITAQIATVENALQYVVAERSKLGAIQNRLEYTKSSLDISSENLSASESRIRDADMAKEMMRLTAANILQQAGVSMLAQANQSPQSVLQLLR